MWSNSQTFNQKSGSHGQLTQEKTISLTCEANKVWSFCFVVFTCCLGTSKSETDENRLYFRQGHIISQAVRRVVAAGGGVGLRQAGLRAGWGSWGGNSWRLLASTLGRLHFIQLTLHTHLQELQTQDNCHQIYTTMCMFTDEDTDFHAFNGQKN